MVVPTYNGRATTGLSHGVSGIALALARVYEVTKEDRFRKATSEHVDFEETLYDPVRGVYPDYRSREGRWPVSGRMLSAEANPVSRPRADV